jgi:YD repeat-containing protein
MNVPKVVPVSPNAASLGIYGAIPVGHYTGVPNISIPIYEIDLDGKKFPINISYHASGIKVAQEASTVGLGWALNAGGCIVKEVRGLDDFGSGGYYYDEHFPISNTDEESNATVTAQNMDEYYKYYNFFTNAEDSEPDIFHFHFASFSGSLFFDHQNAPGNNSGYAKAIFQKETDYLEAIYYPNLDGYHTGAWIVSDGDGYKYYFNSYEQSITYYAEVINSSVTPKNAIGHGFKPVSTAGVITAWYLDSIVSPKNNSIVFTYSKQSVYSPMSYTEDRYVNIDGSYRVGNNIFNSQYICSNSFFAKNEQALLTTISLNNGNINFSYSDRLDIDVVTYDESAKKLSAITINNNQENIKTILLKHSYFGYTTDASQCRLRLDTLSIGTDNEPFNYTFLYNGDRLPSKNTTKGIDYWGYANGSNINTGSFILSPTTVHRGIVYRGANKQSFEGFMRGGILTSIQYPTGGQTHFNYEMNTFQNSFEAYEEIILAQHRLRFNGELEREGEDSIEFTTPTKVRLTMGCYPDYIEDPGEVRIYIDKKDDTGTYYGHIKTFILDSPNDNSFTLTEDYTFSPGTYRISATVSHQNFMGEVEVDFHSIVSKAVTNGGGLRIKTITDVIDATHSINREFSYLKNGNTTGILMTEPRYYSEDYFSSNYTPTENGLVDIPQWGLYLNGYSTPFTPFGNSANGLNVGYSYVEEKISNSNNDNGYNAYTFVNSADGIISNFIKGLPGHPNLLNGQPLSVFYFDNYHNLQKQEGFEYGMMKTSSISGVKVKTNAIAKLFPDNISIEVKFYNLYSERWQLSKQTTSELLNSQWITTTTEYGYNDENWLPNYVKTLDSNNKTIERSRLFSADTNTAMKTKGILSAVTEQSEKIANQPTQKIITGYKNWGNNLFAPEFIKQQTSNQSTPETRITYHNYDSHGNPVYLSKDDVEKVVYLWGYNSQYPIAEIKNATYAEVETAAKSVFSVASMDALSALVIPNETKLKDGSLQKALPHAQVTTFTYKPLVGILTSTDPHGITTTYEYDGFGRLQTIKDENSRAVENHDYHYKN